MSASQSFKSFTIAQPFLGAPLRFQPALGSKELEALVDAYIVGPGSKKDKLAEVSIEFFNHATVDLNTGALTRQFNVVVSPWVGAAFDFELSPSTSQSDFNPSPASSATLADSGYGSLSARSPMKGSRRIEKKSKKVTPKTAEIRLPGFSIMTKDGIDVTSSAGRGTKTKEQREHAHLMRIMKACEDCKKKKVRCDPSHRRQQTAMSRTSTSNSRSSGQSFSQRTPSQNTSPAASTPSRQPTAQTSPPSFDPSSMDDFVLFPEDTSLWNPDMSLTSFEPDMDLGEFNFETNGINDGLNPYPSANVYPTVNDNTFFNPDQSFDFLSYEPTHLPEHSGFQAALQGDSVVPGQLDPFQLDQYGLDQWVSTQGDLVTHKRLRLSGNATLRSGAQLVPNTQPDSTDLDSWVSAQGNLMSRTRSQLGGTARLDTNSRHYSISDGSTLRSESYADTATSSFLVKPPFDYIQQSTGASARGSSSLVVSPTESCSRNSGSPEMQDIGLPLSQVRALSRSEPLRVIRHHDESAFSPSLRSASGELHASAGDLNVLPTPRLILSSFSSNGLLEPHSQRPVIEENPLLATNLDSSDLFRHRLVNPLLTTPTIHTPPGKTVEHFGRLASAAITIPTVTLPNGLETATNGPKPVLSTAPGKPASSALMQRSVALAVLLIVMIGAVAQQSFSDWIGTNSLAVSPSLASVISLTRLVLCCLTFAYLPSLLINSMAIATSIVNFMVEINHTFDLKGLGYEVDWLSYFEVTSFPPN